MTEAVPKPIALSIPIPANEAERLEALRRYKILDTPPEAAFDRITALVARLFAVPIALVSLVDESRAWFKSCYGFDLQEVQRDATICSFALLYNDVLVIPDTRQDDRFTCNPFVQQEPGLRFYAGAPLITEDGFNLGTLCLLDTKPHDALTEEQKANLTDLAAMVVDELELRLAARKIAQVDEALLEVTQGVSAVTGEAFFVALVKHLSKALGMDHACISLLVDENPATLRTIAFCSQGQIVDNVEYLLQDTPCLDVIRQQKISCYAHGIQALFPKDQCLVALGIESYAAIPFFDSAGNLLGLLGVMDSKPLDNVQLVESLLTVFAVRIVAELERQQSEVIRQEAAQRLQLYADVVRNAQVGIVVWQLETLNDPGSFRLVLANPAASATTGFNFESMIGKTMAEGFPELLQTPLVQDYMEVVRTGQALDLGEVFYNEDGITAGVYSLKAFPLPDHCFGLAFENITARKRIETQLQESQYYNQQIAETMPGILFVHDLIEQRIVYTNRQIADSLGYTSEQVQEMGADAVPILIHPDDLERVFQYFENFRFAPEGAVLGIEYQAHHANGEWRWMYSQCVVFNRTAEGLPRQILGVAIDVTDRKQSEEALRQRESELSLITNSVPVLISYVDADQRYRFNNRGYEEWFGRPAADVYGKHLREVLGEAAYDVIRLYVEQVLAGETANFELQVPYKDGGIRDVKATYVPRLGAEGKIEGFVALVSDITPQQAALRERQRAEQTLQEHSDRLSLLYETTSELLSAEHPLALMQRLFSKLAEQMDLHYYYHFRVDEQKGQPMLRLTNHGGISDEQAKSLEWIEFGQSMCGLAAQTREQVVLNQAEIARHPHAQLICSMGVSAYAGQPLLVQGRLLGTLSFASLTRTQFTPEEVDLLQAISKQVAIALDRAELMASLQQQTEDLAQANRIKDEFLAVLSHELRSPLNPILGWTKLLQTGKFDQQKTKQALDIIERNVKQQTQLIDDLLDISRILRGKLALNEAPVDPALIIDSAIETVRLAADAKEIQIKTLLIPSVPPIFGDAGRLQQIMWNLLSNAIKFTPNGGQVEVRLEQRGAEALIQVKDTGKGIAPHFLPYVFESFRQEDSQITRKFGGLGLGLAIVRQLTELHGGTIRAESAGEGTGATFTVQLPLMKQNLQLENPAQTHAAEATGVLQGVRVLVVDDEADMRDLVVTILEQTGAIVQTAASAVQALSVFESFRPMILVSDIGMPEMNGYDLIRQLRSRSRRSGGQIPAIALTAYAMEDDQQQALAAGFHRHLSKPTEPEALVQAIVEVLYTSP